MVSVTGVEVYAGQTKSVTIYCFSDRSKSISWSDKGKGSGWDLGGKTLGEIVPSQKLKLSADDLY